MKHLRLILALTCCSSAFAGYSYDFGFPCSTGSAYVQYNGTGYPYCNGSGNFAFLTSGTGSAIYTGSISGVNANDYEVETMIEFGLRQPQTLVIFLRASSASVQQGVGSYISVELTPQSSASPAPTVMNINQSVSGSVTTLASTTIPVADLILNLTEPYSTIRAVVWGTNLRIFVNGLDVWDMTIPSTTGYPGIGGTSIGISSALVGHHETVVPTAITPTPVGVSALPNSVSLQWPTTTDDANGIGMLRYQISRNGTLIGYSATPDFADANALPTTSYTYGIAAEDQHGNVNTPITVSVTTPPSGTPDPRRTGVRGSGSYWGGGGEQIDVLSGNLNYSLPLVSPQLRSGRKYPLSLNYNAQNWRQGSGYNWQSGADAGYGFGWKLQFGAVTPYYGGSAWDSVDHYVFTDGTGADYRLDINNGSGVWSSRQNAYVWFDASAGRLHFSDGSFWVMSCVSSGLEPDAGTMYPTLIEDPSGNDIGILYDTAWNFPKIPANPGAIFGTTPFNTSSRIVAIQNGALPAPTGWTLLTNGTYLFSFSGSTYSFVYNSDTPVPHLITVANAIHTPENYALTYSASSLGPPFGTDPRYSGLTTTLLSTVTVPITANPYAFTYDTAGSGELMQVNFPYGGHLAWGYSTFQYVGAWSLREVNARYLAADSAGTNIWTYTISRNDTSNPNPAVHANMTLVDASGIGAKTWNFYTSSTAPASWQIGLLSSFVQQSGIGGTILQQDTYTWAQDSIGNAYITSKQTAIDPGGSNPQSSLVAQTLDQYGNVLTSTQYPYNNTSSPLRTYTNTYLTGNSPTGISYASNYIFNRLTSSVLNLGGGVIKTLASNTYDSQYWTSISGATLSLDGGGIPFRSQGLLNMSVTPSATTTTGYWDTGNPDSVTQNGIGIGSYSADASTNYSAPMSIGSATYNESVSYSLWLGITSMTGANGETLSMNYDTAGRPVTGTSSYGGVTHYTYSVSTAPPPLTQTQTGPNGVTTTTLDGLGRTVSVVQPDGASTTTTSYSGNQTTVTDPAGNWKQFTKDALGNLTTVVEPDPANQPGGTLATTYTYDWMNHVDCVDMVRGGTVVTATTYTSNGVTCNTVFTGGTRQTRTFVYADSGLLTSATNPENGTVIYTYNSYHEIATKTDAKGQVTQYTWYAPGQLGEVQYFPTGLSGTEDFCNRATYTWGTNPATYSYSRLTNVAIGMTNTACPQLSSYPGWANNIGGLEAPGSNGPYFSDIYAYTRQGDIQTKTSFAQLASGQISLAVGYQYDSYGQLAYTSYPVFNSPNDGNYDGYYFSYNKPASFSISRDTMGRPVSMTSTYQDYNYNDYSSTWVQNGAYDYAGRLSSLQIANTTETRSYNVNGQLTNLGWSTSSVANMTGGLAYTYSATQNNGQITQMTDTLSGETVVYQYDQLKRLTSATATPTTGSTSAPWSEQFGFDGFGNLTSKTLNGTLQSIPVNAGTNRLTSAYYDLNGNMTSGAGATLTYNVNNRLASAAEVSGGLDYYMYGADGKRIWSWSASTGDRYTFWGAKGEKIGDYSAVIAYIPGGYRYYTSPIQINVNFNGRLIWQGSSFASGPTNAGVVLPDRVGTNRSPASTSGSTPPAQFLPFGDEITSTSNDRVKFATYTRDSYTGLDYARNRYYSSYYGRFLTKDNSGKSARLGSPQTWNRYSYSSNDPVNRNDPKGLCDVMIAGITNSSNNNGVSGFATAIGADTAFPYAGGNTSSALGTVLSAASGLGAVLGQGVLGANNATLTALYSILQAASDPGAINIFTFSGGAQAFTSAYALLPGSIQSRINNVTYISPGAVGNVVSGSSGPPTVVLGTGDGAWLDFLAEIGTTVPYGTNFIDTDCGHDASCEINATYSTLLGRSGNACSNPTTFSNAPGGNAVEVVSSQIVDIDLEDEGPPTSSEQPSGPENNQSN